MPAIIRTLAKTGDTLVAEVTLDGSNSFVFTPRVGQILILRNPTGGTISCTIDGAGGSTVGVPGVGDVDVSSGFTFDVDAGEVEAVWLDSISEYCRGTIAVTGTSLIVMLLR